MRVSLRWLAELIDLPTSDPAVIRAALESLGHEVEGVDRLAADWTGVVVARVDSVEAHPGADKVRVCTVTTGAEPIEVVCGAWNFDAGAVVAYAVPGATLPGGFDIGVRRIRGVASHGMICSERELRLGEDHAGILVLEDDAPIGKHLEEWVELPDTVIDLAITPNRPDAMSMVGIARDLSAYFDVPYRRPPATPLTIPGVPSIAVEIEDPSGCHRFTVRELHRLSVGPSPFWIRRRLRAAGVRPVSNAVDVTNYVMLELGQPLHAFDGDRIDGGRLVIGRAGAGETLTTLDGVTRSLTPEDLVIRDSEGPTSLAGTMGGARSEVGDDTTVVLLEAAAWDPPTIMNMSRRHGLRSEASARFERGVDPELPLEASARAAHLLQQVTGCDVVEGVVDEVALQAEPAVIELTRGEVERVLGPGFETPDIVRLLRSIELDVDEGDPLRVRVPTFRPDLTRPVDLVEEVARLRGYESFGSSVPSRRDAGGWSAEQRRVRQVREVLTGAGLHQAVNLSFLAKDDLDAFGYPPDDEARSVVEVANPLREEESSLRTTLLAGLLRSLRYNISHGAESAALYETGKVFFGRPSPEDPRIPDQPDRLGFALVGTFGGRNLDGAARPVDIFTATALWRLIAHRLDLGYYELEAGEHPGFHPGRCARIVLAGEPIGVIGEIHPTTAAAYDLPGRVAAAEIALQPLSRARAPRQLVAPSTFPHVEFDLAFVVDRSVPASRLLAVTAAAGGDLVEDARIFDEYAGPGLEVGRKSLAIRYVLRAPDRTLTSEEVAPVRRAITAAATEQLGADLRGQT